ncbi:endonuclease V [Sporosarcina sp. FSL W8-0480]|uniref:endonuclease V n=1 Tax=Sporosarcina sp. FSL W8-0480 TaxID=2954701 RepID=UPI0030D846B7
MKIYPIHALNINPKEFISIQEKLAEQLDVSQPLHLHDIQTVAGVDVAYTNSNGIEMGFCYIAVFDLATMEIIDHAESKGHITVPYIPGFLAFRELPLILKAAGNLKNAPDLFLFDGNGILHPRRMGIATQASFFLGTPTIGIAKTFFKVGDSELTELGWKKGNFTDIIEHGEIIGRVLRTSDGVKPVYISPGNQIDMDSSTKIALTLSGSESRLPIPVRQRILRQGSCGKMD